MARGSCLDCVRKHIAQAAILADEAALGYPFHRWYAAGHLAEAESESRGKFPDLAKTIRAGRLLLMSGRGEPDFDDLMRLACLLDGGPEAADLRQDGASSKIFAFSYAEASALPEAPCDNCHDH